jgi:hypothetical protein
MNFNKALFLKNVCNGACKAFKNVTEISVKVYRAINKPCD